MKRDLPAYVYARGKKGYLYFIRTKKSKPVRIHEKPGTPEFAVTYAKLLKGVEPVPQHRTMSTLIQRYRRSKKYTRLAPRTRQDYDKYLTFITERLGALDATKLRRPTVIRMRDANADAVRFANYTVQVTRILMEFAIDLGWRTDNPAKGVELLKSEGRKERAPWPRKKVDAFREAAPHGTEARLLFELLLGTGQRIGDVLKMRWDDIEDDGIRVRQGKTGAALWIPLTPDLQQSLAATERRGETIVADADTGKPYIYHRARRVIARVRAQIGAEELDQHALRYTCAEELDRAGCPDDLIAAITGHRTEAMIRKYAGPSRQKRRAQEAGRRRTALREDGEDE